MPITKVTYFSRFLAHPHPMTSGNVWPQEKFSNTHLLSKPFLLLWLLLVCVLVVSSLLSYLFTFLPLSSSSCIEPVLWLKLLLSLPVFPLANPNTGMPLNTLPSQLLNFPTSQFSSWNVHFCPSGQLALCLHACTLAFQSPEPELFPNNQTATASHFDSFCSLVSPYSKGFPNLLPLFGGLGSSSTLGVSRADVTFSISISYSLLRLF